MATPTRRAAIRQLGAAGAGIALSPVVLRSEEPDLVVAGQPVEIALAGVNPYTARVTIRRVSGGSDESLADGALSRTDWGALARPTRTLPAAGIEVHVPGGNLRCIVGRSMDSLEIAFESRQDGRRAIAQQLRIDRQSGALTFRIDDAPLLGFGEGGPQFDRRGSTDRMVSGQDGYRLRTHGARVPVQWLIGTSGWAIFIHQPLGTFDLTTAEGRFDPSAAASLPLDLFVVVTADPAAMMKAYAEITGYPEMPPLWSLGYLQSHRTLRGPDEIRSVAKTFRDKRLPCDGLIYLGTDFCPSGWNTHNGEFTWHPGNFPEPKRLIDELHAEHFKIVPHIVVEGRRLTGRVNDPCTAPIIPPGRDEHGQWPPDRQVSCYWPVHRELFDVGVDGWWPDQGDDFDGPSRLARIRMYWEGSRQLRPRERPFALHRNGYPGMQRFAAFLWSGDVYSTWETLKTHIPNAVNSGLSGMPLWGTDIGGFVPTAEYTGELHVRWFQFGTFCPLFRAHGRTWHLRLPWGWNTGSVGVSEVAGYTGGADDPNPSELHNAAVEPIVRRYLELRYRLMPYLYSAVRESAQTGLPIVRAMWLHYPDDPTAVARGDQYLWGRDLLIAPVVEKGATSRRVYLPRGSWFDFWTEAPMTGGREIDRTVDLATMPIYVRAGTVLPLGPIRQYTAETVGDPLTLVVYPGADGTFTLYEDDGRTFDYRDGAWMGMVVTWQNRARRVSLSLAPGSRMLPPTPRRMNVRLAGSSAMTPLSFDGRPASVVV